MVFHKSLSDNKSYQVSMNLFSILANLNNAVFGLFTLGPLISKYFYPFYQFFEYCTKSTIKNWYKRHFHVSQYFQFLCKVQVHSIFSLFQFHYVVSHDSKVHNTASSLFLLLIIRSNRLAEFRWSVCISKSQRILCVSFSWIDSGLCIYCSFVWQI